MYTKAVIYSKPNCGYCMRAEELIHKSGIAIQKQVIGHDISRDDFLKLVPDAKTVPQIFMYDDDGEHYIGGYESLVKLGLQ